MTKEVALADLQEHLAEHLEEVKVGVTIRIVDGGTTVAEISPPKEEWVWENGLRVRLGKGSMRDVKPAPRVEMKRDIVDYLLEERGEL